MDLKKEIEKELKLLSDGGFSRGEIEEEMGYAKNYIDQALARGGNKKFLERLKMFSKVVLRKASPEERADIVNEPKASYHDLYVDSLKEQKRILEIQNEFLRRNFETSLIAIAESQAASNSQLKALSWYHALVANGGNERKAEEALVKVGNKAAWYSGLTAKEHTRFESDKKSKDGKRQ